jgi:chemotaxis protein CheX
MVLISHFNCIAANCLKYFSEPIQNKQPRAFNTGGFSVDANMINTFLKATLEIIHDVAHLSYKVHKIYRKKDEKGIGDVTGIIGLKGSGKGTVAVTFDQSTILYIVSKILDMDTKDIGEDIVIDTVAELANMITGRAVRILAEKGFDLDLTVPKVAHGPGHRVSHQTSGPVIAIPYSSEQGNFTVEFSFDPEMKPEVPQAGTKKTNIKPQMDNHDHFPEASNKILSANKPSESLDSGNKGLANWGMPETT